MVFRELLTPNVGNAGWQVWWSLFNVVLHGIGITTLIAYVYVRFFKAHIDTNEKKKWKGLYRWRAWSVACAATCYAFFPVLYYFKRFYDESAPFNWILDGAYWLFNSVLSVETLLSYPFRALPSANIVFRLLLVAVSILIVRSAFKFSILLWEGYREYIDNKLKEITASLGDDAAKKKAEHFRKTVKWLAVALGSIFTGAAVVKSEETKDYLLPALKWLQQVINKLLEIADFPINPDTVGDMIYGLSVILFVVCVGLFLLTLVSAFAAFLYCVIENFPSIVKYVKDNSKRIKYGLKALLIGLVVFLTVFLILTQWEIIINGVKYLVHNSPAAFLALLQEMVLIATAICLFVLVVFFIYAVGHFCYDLLKKWNKKNAADALSDNQRRLITKLIMALVFFVLLGVLLFLFYAPISQWLMDFHGVEKGDFSWVLQKLVNMIVLIMVSICFLIFAGGVVVAAGVEIFNALNLTDTNNALRVLFSSAIKKIIKCLAAFATVFDVIGELLKTIIRIFRGYRTESEKNSAVYVAATFASLASLINTYLGLYSFNRSDSEIWPAVTSLAISFAVQLAMLIFGMKAGQAMAENIIADSKAVGNSPIRTIVKKTFGCLFYILTFLCVLAGIKVLDKDAGIGIPLKLTWPNLLVVASFLGFLYGIVLEIMDIRFLCKHRKDMARSGGRNNQGGVGGQSAVVGQSFGVQAVKSKRIPAKFFFGVYLLLMIVSTGFAYNNLFKCYADDVLLHNQVYDQVRSETENVIRGQINDLIRDYNATLSGLTSDITSYSDGVQSEYENAKSILESKATNSNSQDMKNAHAYFQAATRDLPIFRENLSSIATTDYDAYGKDLTITIYTYDHYKHNRPAHEYTTVAMEISFPGGIEPLKIGTIIDTTTAEAKATTYIEDETWIEKDLNATGRYHDPDNKCMSVAIKSRVIHHADKYDVLNELMIMLESIRGDMSGRLAAVNMNGVENKNGGDGEGNHVTIDTIRNQIRKIEALEMLRLSLVKHCAGPNAKAGIQELHSVVDTYLNPDDGQPADGQNSANVEGDEQKEEYYTEKKRQFAELDKYLEDAIPVCNILDAKNLVSGNAGQVASVESNEGADAADMESMVTDTKESQAEIIRKYRNYAQGITNSDFQLSYDVLLKGFGGMNTTDGKIDALYSARTIAWFILLICLLVDFMAFFAGLLLFQDAFLLDMNSNEKQNRLGYINFEAVLTNYFMPPENDGYERKLRIALIYYLLYRRDSGLDDELIKRTSVDSDTLKGMIARTEVFLQEYGLNQNNADFHLWLKSFVLKNDIQFVEVLNKP